MAYILRQLKERFYPSQDHRVTFLGLSPAGKTTLLYYMKSGETVPTIPTIGLNIETIEVTTSSGKSLKMQAWDVGTGCGITYLYGLIRVFIASSDAIVWVVDGSDEAYLPESVESLQKIISSLDSDYATSREVLPARNIPILILANKSDLPNKMPLDKIRINFAKVISGKMGAVFSSRATEGTPVKNSGLPEAFEWLLLAMEIQQFNTKRNTQKLPMLNPSSESNVMEKLDSWLSRIETDLATEEFLERFRSFSLSSWDHYTHIRIAYVLLTKHGRKEGKDLIFEGLEKYISVSPQTTRKSFHVTMTYFWIQIVHFGIRNMPTLPSDASTTSPSSTLAVDSSLAHPESASPNDFANFLLVNPHVANGNLWGDFYTKEVMMSPRAKSEMVLPDKKPLPNLVVRDAIVKFKQLKQVQANGKEA